MNIFRRRHHAPPPPPLRNGADHDAAADITRLERRWADEDQRHRDVLENARRRLADLPDLAGVLAEAMQPKERP